MKSVQYHHLWTLVIYLYISDHFHEQAYDIFQHHFQHFMSCPDSEIHIPQTWWIIYNVYRKTTSPFDKHFLQYSERDFFRSEYSNKQPNICFYVYRERLILNEQDAILSYFATTWEIVTVQLRIYCFDIYIIHQILKMYKILPIRSNNNFLDAQLADVSR